MFSNRHVTALRRLLLAAMVAMVTTGLPAVAQDASITVAVVDVEAILQESLAAESVRTRLDEISNEFQQRIDAEEQEIVAAERELQEQQSLLAPDVFRERRQEWENRAASLQRRVATARRALAQTATATTRHVQSILIEEVGKLAEERDIDLVLPRSQTLYATAALDLTADALARLNERLPTVPIEIRDVEAEGKTP